MPPGTTDAPTPYYAGEANRSALTRRSLLLGALAVSGGLASPALAVQTGMVRDIAAYDKALAQLAEQYRFALIDIRADWCAVCHRIDREVLSHPTVRRHLSHMPLVRLDVTAMDEGNRRLLAHLGAEGPPTFFVVETATGREYRKTRSLGAFTRRDLVQRLKPFTRL